MANMIYVHIDTTSNAILSRGITASDFFQSIVHQPKNLLLLDPATSFGEFETTTGLKTIRGTEAVVTFFDDLRRRRTSEDIKWIDYSDHEMLKELTPLEISELLYFGHMRTHLHSPFFYKLQNNFVYFDMKDELSRVYYRYLDEFYRILANKITSCVSEKVNEKKSFFRKTKSVEKLNFDLLKKMKEAFQEGVVLCFDQLDGDSNEVLIPIYLVEGNFKEQPDKLPAEQQIGSLHYDRSSGKWQIDYHEDELIFSAF